MIRKITLDEIELWNQVIQEFDNPDIYYTPEHAKLYQIHGDGEPILIYYFDETIRAINVVMVRDLADSGLFPNLKKGQVYDLSTPYGYGGMLIQGHKTDQALYNLKQEYLEFCRNNHFITEFVRFHPLLDNALAAKNLYDVKQIGPSVSIKLDSMELLQERYESSNRRNIKKAEKNKVHVYISNDHDLIDDFMSIYKETMDKDQATDYYYFKKDYYEALFSSLAQHAFFAYAKKDGEIIAMAIFYIYNQKIHYHLSAARSAYSSIYPTNLIIDYVSQWGIRHHYKELVLGGGLGAREDNLFRFKRKFNKYYDRMFYVGQKVFDKQIYEELVSLRNFDEEAAQDTSFFPKYRKL